MWYADRIFVVAEYERFVNGPMVRTGFYTSKGESVEGTEHMAGTWQPCLGIKKSSGWVKKFPGKWVEKDTLLDMVSKQLSRTYGVDWQSQALPRLKMELRGKYPGKWFAEISDLQIDVINNEFKKWGVLFEKDYTANDEEMHDFVDTFRESVQRQLIKEVRGSIPTDVMMGVVGRLPDILRDQFPSVGHAVVRGGKEIRPFDLVQQFVKYPPVFSLGEEVRFALHLGDGYLSLLPSDSDVLSVIRFISGWLGKRGWYIYKTGRQSMGEMLTISILPIENAYVSPGKVMYHLTDVAAVESIKRSGLTPRGSVSRGYPPRVYLFTNVDELNDQIKNNIEAWEPGLSWNDKLTKSPDMVVIEIDPGALRKGTKFEVDPEYSGSTGAVYTKSHIPPEAIVKITPVSKKY